MLNYLKIAVFFLSFNAITQNEAFDSLKQELKYTNHNRSKYYIFMQMAAIGPEGEWGKHNDSSYSLSALLFQINLFPKQKKRYSLFFANSHNNPGFIEPGRGNLQAALNWCKKSKKLFEETDYKEVNKKIFARIVNIKSA